MSFHLQMRLSCPGCQTEYEVPDAALAGRVRTLRCAHCSHQWEYGPLAIANADPAEAGWPGAAPRIGITSKPASRDLPEQAAPFTAPFTAPLPAYEPLSPPAREVWPPPPSSEPPANRYEPALARPIIDEPEIADEEADPIAASTEPPLLSADDIPPAKPAAGNEERFAALVKTSRNEPEDPRPGMRAGLFTTIILLIGIGAGIWAARFHIMQIWPPSTRLFNAINLFLMHLTTPPQH